MRWLAVVLACSGCETLFPLEGRDCPVIAAGFDEDQDEVDDAVDNCPNIPNTDQLDGDRDGVGDACDQRTATPDRIACFFPFNDRSELDFLTLGSDDWDVVSGAAIKAGTSDDFAILQPSITGASVSVAARGLGEAEGEFAPRFGVVVSGQNLGLDTNAEGLTCAVSHPFITTTPPIDDMELGHLESNESKQGTVTRLLDVIAIIHTSAGDDGKPSCVAGESNVPTVLALDTIAAQTGQVAVFVQKSGIAIGSIAVFAPVE